MIKLLTESLGNDSRTRKSSTLTALTSKSSVCGTFFFCVIYYTLCVITFWVSCYDYDIRIKNDVRFVFTSSFCRRAHVLFTLFVFHCIRCPHILHCIFLCLVYPMLPVSLNCPFLIAPSVFSNVFLFSKIDKIYLVTIVIQRAKTFLGKQLEVKTNRTLCS
jgi:hypothetical protein